MIGRMLRAYRWSHAVYVMSHGRFQDAADLLKKIDPELSGVPKPDYLILRCYLHGVLFGRHTMVEEAEDVLRFLEAHPSLSHDEMAYRHAYVLTLLNRTTGYIPFDEQNVSKRTKELFPLNLENRRDLEDQP